MRLKLLTASDIVLAGSKNRIHPDILLGINHRGSNLKWPNVHEVPKTWIELFRSVLLNIIAPQLQSKPLGKWMSEGHQKWNYYEINGNIQYILPRPTYVHEYQTLYN